MISYNLNVFLSYTIFLTIFFPIPQLLVDLPHLPTQPQILYSLSKEKAKQAKKKNQTNQ